MTTITLMDSTMPTVITTVHQAGKTIYQVARRKEQTMVMDPSMHTSMTKKKTRQMKVPALKHFKLMTKCQGLMRQCRYWLSLILHPRLVLPK
jgi:hypothetical protein